MRFHPRFQMRHSLALFLMASSLFFPRAIAEGKTMKKVRRFTHPTHFSSVVTLYNIDGGRCSGWVVKQDVVMTAGHCMDRVGEKLIVSFEDQSLPQIFITTKRIFENGAMADTDMALLSGSTGNVPPITIAPDLVTSRTWCVSLGSGGRLGPQGLPIQQGTMCRTSDHAEAGGLLPVAGDADYGDSGGPVVDTNGQVIGMVEAVAADGSPIFFIVPAPTLQKFLNAGGVSFPSSSSSHKEHL